MTYPSTQCLLLCDVTEHCPDVGLQLRSDCRGEVPPAGWRRHDPQGRRRHDLPTSGHSERPLGVRSSHPGPEEHTQEVPQFSGN